MKKKSVPSFIFVNWEKVSLRGRRSKGKGKGIRARDRARRGREERMSFHYFLCAPKFPLPLLMPATQARKSVLHVQSFLCLLDLLNFLTVFVAFAGWRYTILYFV